MEKRRLRILNQFILCSLLWGYLTGREHLLFYGRLKNLKGRELTDVSKLISCFELRNSLPVDASAVFGMFAD